MLAATGAFSIHGNLYDEEVVPSISHEHVTFDGGHG